MTRAVTIRGVTYPSQRHAAEALGVSTQAITQAVRRGTTDNVGLGPLQKGCEPVRLYKITLGGVAYPSHKAAAEALGVTSTAISFYLKVLRAIENNRPTSHGTQERKA
jgi:hypothetical protein